MARSRSRNGAATRTFRREELEDALEEYGRLDPSSLNRLCDEARRLAPGTEHAKLSSPRARARGLPYDPVRVERVAIFIPRLPEKARASYETVKAVGPGGTDPFAEMTERLRNHFFHYAQLLPHAEDYEALEAAMEEHADSQGEITGGRLADFWVRFADDIAVALAFPEGTAVRGYVTELRDTVGAAWEFVAAAVDQYVQDQPSERWDIVGE